MYTFLSNPLKNSIFVYGSNLAGVREATILDQAYKYYGARQHIKEGFCGQSYAIPLKDENLKTLHPSVIQAYIRNFFTYAREHRHLFFMVNRLGFDLTDLHEDIIIAMFTHRPDNVWLSGKWLLKLNHLDRARLIVHGISDFTDTSFIQQSLISGTKFWNNKFEIITDVKEGPGIVAANWGRSNNIPWTPFPVDNRFGDDSEYINYLQMSWYSTHALIYWDSLSKKIKSLIDFTSREGLRVKINNVMTDTTKLELVG